jgi:hypothetical protein
VDKRIREHVLRAPLGRKEKNSTTAKLNETPPNTNPKSISLRFAFRWYYLVAGAGAGGMGSQKAGILKLYDYGPLLF